MRHRTTSNLYFSYDMGDINPLHPAIIPLQCPITQRPWGTVGATSLVARFHARNSATFINASATYSEFVVSSYPPYTAKLADKPDATLSEHIRTQIIEVDPNFVQFYSLLHEDGVPYTIKAVSATLPTGLVVHPDDIAARQAYVVQHPTFSRPMEKPITILALSRLSLLAGLNTASQIVAQLTRVPEFADAVGRPATDHFVHIVKSEIPTPAHTRAVISALFNQQPQVIKDSLKRAVTRLSSMPDAVVSQDDRLLIRLANTFPDDPSCFAAYFLRFIDLPPGRAVYISPCLPYCVLEGDFVEASSKSDAAFYGGLVDSSIDTDVAAFLKTMSFKNTFVEVSSFVRSRPYFHSDSNWILLRVGSITANRACFRIAPIFCCCCLKGVERRQSGRERNIVHPSDTVFSTDQPSPSI